MPLLQDVLRPTHARDADATTSRLSKAISPAGSPSHSRGTSPTPGGPDSSDEDELIGVVSVPGTPRRLQSRAASRSTSPTRSGTQGAASRRAPGPLHISSITSTKTKSKTDPVRVLTTDLIQRVFSFLNVRDLASCSRVSLKWNKSQSINYVWFLQNRKLELGDKTLPTGKWTRRESKENWRKNYMRTSRTLTESELTSTSRYGYSTPSGVSSGYSTPRSIREEKWAAEAQETLTNKLDMREMYKEMGGRKARGKNKVGMGGGGAVRDRGGWEVSID